MLTLRDRLPSYDSSIQVLQELGFFCRKNGLRCDWLVSARRSTSALENVLLKSEVEAILGIVLPTKTLYFSPGYLYPHFNEIPGDFEGATAYTVNESSTLILPTSSTQKNRSHCNIELQFDSDNLLRVKQFNQEIHTGRSRTAEQFIVLQPYDYIEQEAAYFDDEGFLLRMQDDFDQRMTLEKLKELRPRLIRERLERIKAMTELNYAYPVDSIYHFEVLKTGRILEDSLVYQYEMDSRDLVSKAGNNYLLQIGQVIGDQVALKEKELQRKADVYLPFARSYTHDIRLEIPAGYDVVGIDKMVAFLEAAYQFTQVKILLKKKG